MVVVILGVFTVYDMNAAEIYPAEGMKTISTDAEN